MNHLSLLIVSASFASLSALAQDGVTLDAGDPKVIASVVPTWKPASAEYLIVYQEPGRYGGWPANHTLGQ